jgi:hypothetical protein
MYSMNPGDLVYESSGVDGDEAADDELVMTDAADADQKRYQSDHSITLQLELRDGHCLHFDNTFHIWTVSQSSHSMLTLHRRPLRQLRPLRRQPMLLMRRWVAFSIRLR